MFGGLPGIIVAGAAPATQFRCFLARRASFQKHKGRAGTLNLLHRAYRKPIPVFGPMQ
jgi:hypothetical protein